MPAMLSDITRWFDRGVADGASHMIIKCDTFDMADGDCCYPVFVSASDDVRRVESENGDRTMEVYVLDPARKAEQLSTKRRVFNYE